MKNIPLQQFLSLYPSFSTCILFIFHPLYIHMIYNKRKGIKKTSDRERKRSHKESYVLKMCTYHQQYFLYIHQNGLLQNASPNYKPRKKTLISCQATDLFLNSLTLTFQQQTRLNKLLTYIFMIIKNIKFTQKDKLKLVGFSLLCSHVCKYIILLYKTKNVIKRKREKKNERKKAANYPIKGNRQ